MRRRSWLIGCLGLALLPAVAADAQEARRPARRPELWAIVVGVDDPASPGDRPATRDAEALHRWFVSSAGWDRSHVLLLNELGSRDPGPVAAPRPSILPVKENLDWAFRVWLRAKAQPGDTIVFAYYGRSIGQVRPEGTPGQPVARYYLMTRDASLASLKGTAFALDEALDEYAAQGQFQVVCWLGTSLVDQTPGVPAGAAPGRPARPTGQGWLRTLTRWPGVTAWLAADSVASEGIGEAAGRFHAALLRALGSPERPRNLVACLRDLRERPDLRAQGFAALGGVSPEMTLWFKDFGQPKEPPRPEMVLQLGHADRVTGLLATPDGQRMITSSMDSTIRVWSIADRALLRVLPESMVGATCLAATADGRWLVSSDGRSKVFVHDMTRDFAPRFIPQQPHKASVTRVAMLPDGAHFVTVDRDAHAEIWDVNRLPLASRPWLPSIDCLDVASGAGLVAASCGDGRVRLSGPDGSEGPSFASPAGPPGALAVAPDGRRLAIGLNDGRVVVREGRDGRMVEHRVGDGPISRLAISRPGLLAIGHVGGLRLLDPSDAARPPIDLMDRPPADLLFSPDGRYLAACVANTGEVRVWNVATNGLARVVLDDPGAKAVTLAFNGDGRAILAGGVDGSIQATALEPEGQSWKWSIAAHRGKVQQLAAAPSREHLLLIDESARAQVWDLKQRECRRVPGAWTSGVFVKGQDGREDLILSAHAEAKASPGTPVLVDGVALAPIAAFNRASGPFRIAEDVAFVGLTLSHDGARVAATADPALAPLVCVWDVKTRRLTHWIAKLDDPARTLSFSSDGKSLLTAGDGPEARLWDLPAAGGEVAAPAVTFRAPGLHNITRALIRPDVPNQAVTGHSNGQIILWSWQGGRAKTEAANLAPGIFSGAIKALAFGVRGGECHLAAAGDSKTIWFARMGTPIRRVAELGTGPHHFEQVNDLIAWPGTSIIASGSDDTTVRFWDLEKKALWGTFSAAAPASAADGPDDIAAPFDWVLFTPDGHFDASAVGRTLVRFRQRDEARPMEQFEPSLDAIELSDRKGAPAPLETTLYSFELSELLRDGRSPKVAAASTEPPRLALEVPAEPDPDRAETALTLSLGAADLRDVRLYQNGVPIAVGPGEARGAPPFKVTVPVRLLKGVNRFYAMASREGAIDGRSREVELIYNGQTDPAQIHVIALGVGDYERQRLAFARRDAERIGDVLYRRGGQEEGARPGMRVVLTDGQVNPEGIAFAFRQVAAKVKGRPQDRVVVFLAGHTGVMDQRLFCLLLNSFPFPKDAPESVAARGANIIPDRMAGIDRKHVLPYYLVAQHLTRLDALQRLVIVDACEAGAINEDPKVAAIQKWMEIASRPARTSYLMAARRGELALEAEPLRHGLFTFTLLRGMGALEPDEVPRDVDQLGLPATADLDGDDLLTTGELDRYVERTLPVLSRQFPKWVVASRQAVNLPPLPAEAIDQKPRLQNANVSFPLFRVGRPGSTKVAGAAPARPD